MLIDSFLSDFVADVDSILRKQFNKQLFYPKKDDQYRLLKLRVWSERHKVSIAYILSVLIPHFERIAYKHSRRPREKVSKGIGTTIPILTGSTAESFLVEQILKDFPDNENVISWREEKRDECLRKISQEDDVATRKPKSVLDYTSLAAFRKAYIARIHNTQSTEEKLAKQIAKQPWRDNPWR